MNKIEYYFSNPYTEQANLFEKWNFDIKETQESDFDNYKIYKDELEDPDVFEYNYSVLKMISVYIEHINTIIKNQPITAGEIMNFDATYQIEGCCSDLGMYDVDVTSNFTLLVHLGLDFIYLELDEYTSNDLVNSSIMYAKYNETDITEYKMYNYSIETINSIEKKEYMVIDYKLGEDSTIINVTGDESVETLKLLKIDENGSYEGLVYEGDVPILVSVDIENELYFWSIFMEDTDYRNLSLYIDGVFQLEYRLLYHSDTETFQELNNTVTYNAKFVDGWEYYLGGTGNIEDSDTLYYEILSGKHINLHILEPNYVLTIDQDIDIFITEENYTNLSFNYGNEQYSFQKIPYSTFINHWDGFDNIWDHFSVTENTIIFNDEIYSIDNRESFISIFAGVEFAEFVLDAERKALLLTKTN